MKFNDVFERFTSLFFTEAIRINKYRFSVISTQSVKTADLEISYLKIENLWVSCLGTLSWYHQLKHVCQIQSVLFSSYFEGSVNMLLLIPFGAKIRPLYSKFHDDPVYQSTIFTITIPFIVDFLFQSTISKNMCVKCSLVFLPAVFNFRPKPVFHDIKARSKLLSVTNNSVHSRTAVASRVG